MGLEDESLSAMLSGIDALYIAQDGMERVNGKRISKNVYAKTREECEEKLAELIKTMKAEIAEMKKQEKNA